jgi:hypothetical protein
MKKTKIIFWVSTVIIVLFEGVLPALTSQTKLAQDGITHLGYPLYFATMLTVFKVLGAIALIFPKFPARLKEWAYAGFIFDFTSALISTWVVDGLGWELLLPAAFLLILYFSYTSYHKLKSPMVA